MKRTLHFLSIALFGAGFLVPASPVVAAKKKSDSAEKAAKPGKASDRNAGSSLRRYDLGVAAGLFNVYLPQPSLGLIYSWRNVVQAGFEVGYVRFARADFVGQSSYQGLDVKFFPWRRSFFAGLALGSRTINVETMAAFTSENTDESGTVSKSTDVTYKRHVTQRVIVPRVGWVLSWGSAAAIVTSLGILVPNGSDASVTSDPEAISGVPDSKLDDARAEKLADVTQSSNAVLPHLEVKFAWFFDLW